MDIYPIYKPNVKNLLFNKGIKNSVMCKITADYMKMHIKIAQIKRKSI